MRASSDFHKKIDVIISSTTVAEYVAWSRVEGLRHNKQW